MPALRWNDAALIEPKPHRTRGVNSPKAPMFDPLTLGLASFLGGLLSKTTDKLQEKAIDKVVGRFTGEILVRSAGHFGMATNHDAETAIRRAQMASLTCLIRAYEAAVPVADEAKQAPHLFVEPAIRFAESVKGKCDPETLALSNDVIERTAASLDATLAGIEKFEARAAALRRAAEEAAFAELEAALADAWDDWNGRKVEIPDGFRTWFFHGRRKTERDVEITSWHDGFILFAAKALKGEDKAFEAIFTTSHLAGINELASDTHEIATLTQATVATIVENLDQNAARLARLEGLLVGIADDVRAIRANVEHLTRELGLTHAEKERLAVDLAEAQRDLSGTVSLVSGFLETIVGRQVPFDQFQVTFFKIVAEWISAGERLDALAASRNLSPQILALRERAKKAYAEGRVDAFEDVLAHIEKQETEALARLQAEARERESEMRHRREGLIETKSAKLALARSRLRHEEAAWLVAEIVDLSEADEDKRLAALLAEQDRYLVEGRDLGLNASLEVAIAIARLGVDRAIGKDAYGAWLGTLGAALCTLGERESGTALLEEAAVAYHAALEERERERVPLDWAVTQNNLGNVLFILGERESGTARLEAAAAAYRVVLEERTRERDPLGWAAAQNNLGNALSSLGARESGTARLEAAVAAYSAALEERGRERVPLDWAVTQNNLGIVLTRLGARESGAARLEEAAAAYRAALEERTRERVPLDWAMTQNNLGTVLLTLGERESGMARLEEAAAAYRAALEERTRERVPLDWAATQNSLGNTFWVLGDRASGTAWFKEAVAAYRLALEEGTRERVPLLWAMTQNNLGTALQSLGEREVEMIALEEAAAAYRLALEERTRERVPLDWAMTQHNLGEVLQMLGARNGGIARLEEAVTAFRLALKERTRALVPLRWAATQNSLASALKALGKREVGTVRLEEAVASYFLALEERTRERVPLEWAITQSNLGDALLSLGERDQGTAFLEQAARAYRAALEELTEEQSPHYHSVAMEDLERVLALIAKRKS